MILFLITDYWIVEITELWKYEIPTPNEPFVNIWVTSINDLDVLTDHMWC